MRHLELLRGAYKRWVSSPDWAGEVVTYVGALEAEVERLSEGWSEANSALLDARIEHIGEKDELRREVERLARRVPNPDDLRVVCDLADAAALSTDRDTIRRVRATLEGTE